MTDDVTNPPYVWVERPRRSAEGKPIGGTFVACRPVVKMDGTTAIIDTIGGKIPVPQGSYHLTMDACEQALSGKAAA